jgi:TolA-binding protein
VAKETPKQPAGQQAEVDRGEQLIEWGKAHRRSLTIAGVATVVVAAGVWFVIAARERREAFARRELDQARTSAEAGNLPLAASDLSRIIDSYGGTMAGDEANLLRGQVRLLQGQPTLAVTELQQFVAKGLHDQYRSPAYALLGSALEEAHQFKAAGNAYEEAAKSSQYALVSARMLLDAGLAYTLAADTAAAVRVYEQVVKEHQDSPLAVEARLRLGELGRFDAAS